MFLFVGSNVLGQVNRGAAVLMSGLDLERLILAAGPVGLMQAAIDVAFPYVHERKQFNEPIGTFQVGDDNLMNFLRSFAVLNSYCKEKWLTCFHYSVLAVAMCIM